MQGIYTEKYFENLHRKSLAWLYLERRQGDIAFHCILSLLCVCLSSIIRDKALDPVLRHVFSIWYSVLKSRVGLEHRLDGMSKKTESSEWE